MAHLFHSTRIKKGNKAYWTLNTTWWEELLVFPWLKLLLSMEITNDPLQNKIRTFCITTRTGIDFLLATEMLELRKHPIKAILLPKCSRQRILSIQEKTNKVLSFFSNSRTVKLTQTYRYQVQTTASHSCKSNIVR